MTRKDLKTSILGAGALAALLVPPAAAEVPVRFGAGVRPPALRGVELTTFVVAKEPPLRVEDAVARGRRIVDYANARIVVGTEQADLGDGSVIRFVDESDGSAALELSVNRRRLFFNAGLARYSQEEETKNLPSEQALLPAVQHHLDALDLLPPREELQAPVVGGLNLAVKRDDGTSAIYRKLLRVRFNRTLAGLPVEGGSRVVALLGEDGALVSLAWNWPVVEGRRVEPTEAITDAMLRSAILARLQADLKTARDILVERLDLVLYDRDGVLEPAVRIQAQATFVEPVANGRRGETRTNLQPYDTLVPVLRAPQARYPYEPNAEARRRIGTDPGLTAE
jgi:hypothetical protein